MGPLTMHDMNGKLQLSLTISLSLSLSLTISLSLFLSLLVSQFPSSNSLVAGIDVSAKIKKAYNIPLNPIEAELLHLQRFGRKNGEFVY